MSAADPKNHESRELIVDGSSGQGTWTSGLTSADELTTMIRRVRAERTATTTEDRVERLVASPAGIDAAERYFTNAARVDQTGRPRPFDRNLLRDRVVVINVFFWDSKCNCVEMGNTQARL
jgi:hypothetical protein